MKKVVSVLAIILLLFGFYFVKAADEIKLEFKSDKSEIEKGEEVVLTISSDKLTGIEGRLKYDSSVWTLEKKESQHSFTLNDENGKFALANLAGEEEISVDITFKSKKDTTVDSSTITISEIVGSNLTGNGYDITDKPVTIKFKKHSEETEPTENEVNNFVPINEVNNTNTNVITNTNTNVNNNTNAEKKEIPYTGSSNIFAILVAIGTIGVISYIQYKKYDF